MTITYPRAMPRCGANQCDFEIEPKEITGGEQVGRIITSVIAPSHWGMKFSRKPTTEAEFDDWRAWLSSLRGASKLFYGRDLRRGKWPRAYRNTGFGELTRAGGGGFDGTADVDVSDSFAVALSTLPAGFVVSINDYVGLTWGSGSARTLHRFVEAGVADGSGDLTLAVEPEIPHFVPDGCVANFAAPTCLMKIRSGSAEPTADDNERRVTFEAFQFFETSPD